MWGEVTHTVAGSWCCLFSAGRGSRGLTESSQKVQSWSTNSSRLPCRSCGLVQLGCCVWGLGASSRQKSAPFKTSLGGRADDLARCVTHHTPCWQASQFQLHGCSSHRCSVCVCVCVWGELVASAYQHSETLWIISRTSTEQEGCCTDTDVNRNASVWQYEAHQKLHINDFILVECTENQAFMNLFCTVDGFAPSITIIYTKCFRHTPSSHGGTLSSVAL